MTAKNPSVRRAADRQLMARKIFAILSAAGRVAILDDYFGPRSIAVDFAHNGGLAVTVTFEADDPQDICGQFCLAWHISGGFDASGAWADPCSQISAAFGAAMRASVNPHHRRKCTAFAIGFDDLCAKLTSAVSMLHDGTAYV